MRRDTLLAQLSGLRYDVLVIGGGIVGAGVARDAAMRGLKVAVVEQGDFASGTSSKTSKLIHGGLRYLEHGRVRLVFESLRERRILRTIAPSLVRPLPLLLPAYQGDTRPVWKIRAGLWLYDVLAARHALQPHRLLSARRALEREPALRVDGLKAAGVYADCQMDDARLCLANILQAVRFGAVCANYVRVEALLKANGRLCGATLRDVFTGRRFDVRAAVVVNAAGPWGDRLRRLSDAAALPRLAPTKGIHLILPRLAQEALFAQARADGRMLFVLPWGAYTLVGTTETSVGESLDELAASADEVGYLLEEVNRLLPGSHVDADDVIGTFAGARPLLAFAGRPAGRASREHAIEVDAWGLISVLGGKFTTYRHMSRQAVDGIVSRSRWRADRCLSDQVGLIEPLHAVTLAHWQDVTRPLDPDVLGRLLIRYGAGTLPLLQRVAQDPSLAQPVCPHHEVIEAELVHALEGELACTLTDLLARRTRIAWSSCQGLDALSRTAELLQRYGGWSAAQVEGHVAAYRRFLAEGLSFRPARPAAPEAHPQEAQRT